MKELSIEEMTSLKGGQQSNSASVSISTNGFASLSFSSAIANGGLEPLTLTWTLTLRPTWAITTLTSILINRMRQSKSPYRGEH